MILGKHSPFIAGALLVLLLAQANPVAADGQGSARESPEDWVREQVQNNTTADLLACTVCGADTTLSATFVQNLLRNQLPDLTVSGGGVRIQHAVIAAENPFTLANADIPFDVQLEDCTFNTDVDLSQAHFMKGLSLNRSIISSLNLYGTKIDGDLSIMDARLDGHQQFGFITVGRNLWADGVRFANPADDDDHYVSFTQAKITGSAEFDGARFQSRTDFVRADVGGRISFIRAYFGKATSPDNVAPANFSTLKADDVDVSNAEFNGPVDFGFANVARSVAGKHAYFTASPDGSLPALTLNTAKIGGNAVFAFAAFNGRTDFVRADIGVDLDTSDSHFNAPLTAPDGQWDFDFDSVKVGRRLDVERATFTGSVTFFGAEIAHQFYAGNARFDGSGGVNLGAMKVGDLGSFPDTVFNGPVDFDGSSFARLDFRRACWTGSTDVSCENRRVNTERTGLTLGFTYDSIAAGATADAATEVESSSWSDEVEPLLARADYDSADYTRAESYFKQAGHPVEADQTFIARQNREIALLPPLSQVGGLLQFVVIGYGRRPWQALVLGSVIVVLAWWRLYSRSAWFEPSPKNPNPKANFRGVRDGMWCSLESFAPVINLHARENWQPVAGREWITDWEKWLSVAGWIVVPLGVAAITGLVK